jgi:hypothetical protein
MEDAFPFSRAYAYLGSYSIGHWNQSEEASALMEGMPLASSSECKDFFLVLYS